MPTASSSSMKMIEGWCLRASANSRRIRAEPTPTNISTNERCALEVEVGARLGGDRLRHQGLAGAGRPVQQHALGHARTQLLEPLGIASGTRRSPAAPRAPRRRRPRPASAPCWPLAGLDLLRLGGGHRPPHLVREEDEQAMKQAGSTNGQQQPQQPRPEALRRSPSPSFQSTAYCTVCKIRRLAVSGSAPSSRSTSSSAASRHLQLLRGRLAGGRHPLQLVARPPQRARDRRCREWRVIQPNTSVATPIAASPGHQPRRPSPRGGQPVHDHVSDHGRGQHRPDHVRPAALVLLAWPARRPGRARSRRWPCARRRGSRPPASRAARPWPAPATATAPSSSAVSGASRLPRIARHSNNDGAQRGRACRRPRSAAAPPAAGAA